MIAFRVLDADHKIRIYVRPINRTEARVLPGAEEAIYMFWSPNGKSLAFTGRGDRGQRLKRIDLAGGSPQDLAKACPPFSEPGARITTCFF